MVAFNLVLVTFAKSLSKLDPAFMVLAWSEIPDTSINSRFNYVYREELPSDSFTSASATKVSS